MNRSGLLASLGSIAALAATPKLTGCGGSSSSSAPNAARNPEPARFGAFHTAEVPYAYNTLYTAPNRPFVAADHRIADQMSSYRMNFAAHGDPNGPGLPPWPAYGSAAGILELGDKNAVVPLAGSPAKPTFSKHI